MTQPARRRARSGNRARRTGIRPQRTADADPRSAKERGSRADGRPTGKRGLPGGRSSPGHRKRPGHPSHPADQERTTFDGFAEHVNVVVSSGYFFAACVASVVAWALFGPAAEYSSAWQFVINTGTTIVTFLMVALLQNSTRRTEKAMHRKLDAIADALADFMDKADIELEDDVRELEEAVGLEKKVGSG